MCVAVVCETIILTWTIFPLSLDSDFGERNVFPSLGEGQRDRLLFDGFSSHCSSAL